jgi:hypothetical protein
LLAWGRTPSAAYSFLALVDTPSLSTDKTFKLGNEQQTFTDYPHFMGKSKKKMTKNGRRYEGEC